LFSLITLVNSWMASTSDFIASRFYRKDGFQTAAQLYQMPTLAATSAHIQDAGSYGNDRLHR
jgi:hypothetical protein